MVPQILLSKYRNCIKCGDRFKPPKDKFCGGICEKCRKKRRRLLAINNNK